MKEKHATVGESFAVFNVCWDHVQNMWQAKSSEVKSPRNYIICRKHATGLILVYYQFSPGI